MEIMQLKYSIQRLEDEQYQINRTISSKNELLQDLNYFIQSFNNVHGDILYEMDKRRSRLNTHELLMKKAKSATSIGTFIQQFVDDSYKVNKRYKLEEARQNLLQVRSQIEQELNWLESELRINKNKIDEHSYEMYRLSQMED